jgi:hypothetical protein
VFGLGPINGFSVLHPQTPKRVAATRSETMVTSRIFFFVVIESC